MKIGDYVRTKDGYICKYTQDNNVLGIETIGNDRYFLIRKSETIKSSPNIIDLIEEDDYVNNQMVWHIKEDNDGKYLVMCFDGLVIREKDIETIVTKEQFERCEYNI